jgi:anthranilate/para-aminobenzoate synthase component II
MLLMIDNYDSFTYNLVQYLGELGQDVQVYRNDEIDLKKVAELKPKFIVISPGPCTPNEAGISLELRLFGASKHRASVWRQNYQGQNPDARQNIAHSSH